MNKKNHSTSDAGRPSPIYTRRAPLADRLGVSTRTLANWQRAGAIPFIKVGRTVLFKTADVEAALERFRHAAVGEGR